jgi:hypothetical protein
MRRFWYLDSFCASHISPSQYAEPSLIVGVEVDVFNRTDWYGEYTHPLQIVQWTMASARGHPVLIDTIRRIVQKTLDPNTAECGGGSRSGHILSTASRPEPVIFRTGPGPFTDAVFQYLLSKYGKSWTDFRRLPLDGWRYYDQAHIGAVNGGWGDIRLLQMTGFSPGVHFEMGAQSLKSPAAMVHHYFKGTWRHRRIALKVFTGFVTAAYLVLMAPLLVSRLKINWFNHDSRGRYSTV